MDEANVEDMDTKLSEIKKIFNDYMPKVRKRALSI